MNKIYRVIWSKIKNSYVVVSEIAKSSGKCSSSLNKKIIAAFLAAGTVLSVTGSAWAELPEYQISGYGNYDEDGGNGTVWGAWNGVGLNEEDEKQEIIDLLQLLDPSVDLQDFGSLNTAWGYKNRAFGGEATAFGLNNKAYGPSSTAWGEYTDAFGYASTSFGYFARALGETSTAWGQFTTAYSRNATTWGQYTLAKEFKGDDHIVNATAFGYHTWAAGGQATAFGLSTLASGWNSTAFGVSSQAIGPTSTAFGDGSVALGENSLAALGGVTGTPTAVEIHEFDDDIDPELGPVNEHYVTTYKGKDGVGAVAIGQRSRAYKDYTYAIGKNAKVKTTDSLALGNNTEVAYAGGAAFGADSKVLEGDAPAAGGFNLATGEDAYTDNTNVWTATTGPISVGSSDVTRQIKYVAAGSADTDAVNVAQLKAAKVEIIAGDNVEVIKDTSSGHTKYTIHALNAIVEEGDGIHVDTDTPDKTTNSNGITTDVDGEAAGVTPAASANPIKLDKENNHTTTYTVSATGGGGIAEISFNGDNKDAQIDNPKVLNIEGGATGELSDGNIGVESDGKDTLTVKLARDLKDVDSITVNKNIKVGDNTTIEGDAITTKTVNADTVKVGSTSINDNGITTDNGNGPSVTKDGIDGGGKKITNVAPGAADTDAVNMSQLRNASGDIYNELNRLDNSTRKGLAGAAALAALHPLGEFNPDDKLQFSAGVGNYRGETAAAVGMFYRPDESVMFSIGGTFGNSDNMVNAGITFGLDGTRNRITRSRTAMAREIQDLRSLVTQMAARMDRLEGANSETAMFPDVPENHWAYEYVEDLQKRGALKGYPDGLFKGDRAMTRYEFAAMLDRLVRSGVTLDSKVAKEFEPELGRIYVERISGQDNDRKKIERVRVNNSDSKYPEGKTRDVYGSKIVTEVPKAAEAK